MKQQRTSASPCPCGGARYQDCCAPLHAGMSASSAESLMRSRYSAFVMKLEAYLLQTWHPSTRPERVEFDEKTRWLGLRVVAHSETVDSAHVEFIATFAEGGGRAQRLHENSQFVREHAQWRYLSGVVS